MSATVDTSIDWQAEVLRLKFGPRQMSAAEIAEEIGKHAATVRKVVARASEEEVQAVLNSESFTEPQGDIERAVEKPEDPLHAFKQEAGEAVGDMPKEPEPDPISYEVRLAGTQQQAFDFGSEELPVGGTLKLKSDKLASGFYGLGDVITGTFTARIVDVAGAERYQRASEEYRVQPQGHVALITEIKLKP